MPPESHRGQRKWVDGCWASFAIASTFFQVIIGLAAALFLAGGGFYFGQATAPSEIVDCLNWASVYFDEPTAVAFFRLFVMAPEDERARE
jgi:hypothetical protein